MLTISDDEFSAFWAKATNEQIDEITEFAEKLLGKPDSLS